jgi:hypothetical protein
MQNGATDHFDIVLSLATLSGTWRSAAGQTGVFFFNPPNPAPGSPRPVPGGGLPSGTTLRGVYHVRFQAMATDNDATSPFSFGVTLPSAPTAHFIAAGSGSTANCPGTAANPQAAAGHLCVYEQSGTNVKARFIVPGGTLFALDTADPFGAAVLITALAAGETGSFGSWAVTAP